MSAKFKKTARGLLIVPLLALFASGAVGAPAAQFTPPANITVTMYELISPSGDLPEDPVACTYGNESWGCTAIPNDPTYAYTYTTNPVTVSIESDYLLDVVPQEMSPGMFHPTAIQAQAIAARTYAYFHIHSNSTINNSANFQVFLPYKFESFSSAYQQIIRDATASRYYLTYYNQESPAFTEFFSDRQYHTESNPPYPYLLGVADPISIHPTDPAIDGHGRGLSQYGASRWARGNTYGNINYTGVPWSVQWRRHEQILVHYYTGIQLRDSNGNSLLNTTYRWNALSQSLPNPIWQPYAALIRLQNTSAYAWPNDYYISYRWLNLDGSLVSEPYNADRVSVGTLDPGDDRTYVVNVRPPALSVPRTLILQWDMVYAQPWPPYNDYWFSASGWPTQDTSLLVSPCQFLPMLMKNYAGW